MKSPLRSLSDGICDYLKMMALSSAADDTFDRHRRVLGYYSRYVESNNIKIPELFTEKTVSGFIESCSLNQAGAVIRRFSRFLYREKRIDKPTGKYHPILPEIFNRYLTYKRSLQDRIHSERIVLTGFAGYLETHGIRLETIHAEDVDNMLATSYGHLAAKSQNSYKSCLRGFLRYLYVNNVMGRNLAPLIVNRRIFAGAKPPRFLLAESIKKLFAGLKHETARDLRVNAMVYLAYHLGLRPMEISKITLDDISFKAAEVTIRDRKNCIPAAMPLPATAIKPVAVYIVGARPKTERRRLFLSLKPEYKPLTGNHVAKEISWCMKRVGLSSSAYALRHTYAQNLLERGVSIFEIKELMGHECIQTTQRYLHIHIKLMRKVLFDEEI